MMKDVLQVLMYSLPLLLVLVGAVVIVQYYFKLEKLRAGEQRMAGHSAQMLKIRLLAYERLVLFLERISPQQLVIRNNNMALSARDLQRILRENIRDEFEHNLVQQIYISAEGWARVDQARLWVLQLVNESAESIDEKAGGHEFLTTIVEKGMASGKNPVQTAIDYLKSEVREMF